MTTAPSWTSSSTTDPRRVGHRRPGHHPLAPDENIADRYNDPLREPTPQQRAGLVQRPASGRFEGWQLTQGKLEQMIRHETARPAGRDHLWRRAGGDR